MSEVDLEFEFGAHIERAARDLPIVQYHNRRLVTKTSKKVGASYQDVITDFGTKFGIDLATVRSGWRYFEQGIGRIVLAEPLGTSTPAKPTLGAKASGLSAVMLITVASIDGMGELEISDTAMRDAVKPIYLDYKGAQQAKDGCIPVVEFIPGVKPAFRITDWVGRDPEIWGAI